LHLAIDLLFITRVEFAESTMSTSWPNIAAIIIGSAGALTYLFLMVIIVGHRRRREFERVLFFLALAVFAIYAGVLLVVDASIHASRLSPYSNWLAPLLAMFGIAFLPGLVSHTHWAYGATIVHTVDRANQTSRRLVLLCYIPSLFIITVYWRALGAQSFSPLLIVSAIVSYILIVAPILVGAFLLLRSAKSARNTGSRDSRFIVEFRFRKLLAASELAVVIMSAVCLLVGHFSSSSIIDLLSCSLLCVGVLPGAALAYAIIRYDIFEISAQRNLVYAVSAAFLALIYLTVVRRVSVWLEPVFPQEATAAILLFTSLAFFEPLQRLANKLLLRRTQEQMRKVQTVSAELQREARNGNTEKFVAFANARIRDEFGLEQARVVLGDSEGSRAAEAVVLAEPPLKRPAWAGQPVRLRLGKSGSEIGYLEAIPAGSLISGETRAALEFLAEQLPASIELCRTIEQKVALERELALRERLALVGQMTASISHTLKNPIGSMKTVLQVQLENPALTPEIRDDLTMVLAELDRLNTKVGELLSYARPPVHGGGKTQSISLGETAARIVELLTREAERRGCNLVLRDESQGTAVAASEEALSDILSNLIVNALEAVPQGGNVTVHLTRETGEVRIMVTDDGPGIPESYRAHLFEPFFTTKASGTGLGLATVARRAEELGGVVTCESPIAEGHGTRFTVRFPLARNSASS
jgi:signal transduction histidine kinase